MSDEDALAHRSGLERLRREVDHYVQALPTRPEDEVPEREYDFKFNVREPLESQLRDWQQTVDIDFSHDERQLNRRNDQETKQFERYIAKLDETIRSEEIKEFERQDEVDYAHLKSDPDQWNGHKQAQEFEAGRREELRSIFYTNVVQAFNEQQRDRHQDRLDVLNERNGENVLKLNEAYAEHAPNLEGIVKALEEANENLQHISPPRPANDQKERPVAVGMSREMFHSLVLAGQELEREQER